MMTPKQLKAIRLRQVSISNQILAKLDMVLNADLVIDLSKALQLLDPPNTRNLFLTLSQYEGTKISNDFANTVSWQLAARWDELNLGVLTQFQHVIKPEWALLKIAGTANTTWKDVADAGQTLRIKALTGHAAGHILAKKVPNTWLRWLAYQIGFSRRLLYTDDPWLFTGLELWGYLCPNPQQPANAEFSEWQVNPAIKKSNQLIIERRLRFELKEPSNPTNRVGEAYERAQCPFDYNFDCNKCHRTNKDCYAATVIS